METVVGLIRDERVTHLLALPALYGLLLDVVDTTAIKTLEVAIVAGEACSPELVEQHHALCGDRIELFNEYGPTEATVWASVHKTGRGEIPVPIGRPIPGSQIRVVDQLGHPTPIGFPGELWIGGSGVTQGYHGMPPQTQQAFTVTHTDRGPRRFYMTGDLGTFVEDGSLIFVGRADQQVKVRGFRVETAAVEAALESLPDVSQAAVIARQAIGRPGNRLIAYLTGSAISAADVRARLQALVPNYMVPDVIALVEDLPRLPNGKLDHKALPDPDRRVEDSSDYEAPGSESERILAGIWAELLGRDRVGIHDDYFALGGDSILSIQMISRARQQGLRIEPRDILTKPTVAELARSLSQQEVETVDDVDPVANIPLTPVQAWFFDCEFEELSHWNQSRVLRVRGRVDVDALGTAVDAVIDRHPMLRARFHRDQSGEWVQDIQAPSGGSLVVVPDQGDRQARLASVQSSLDILAGRPFAAAWITSERDEAVLLLAVHHLVVDSVSWETLLGDLDAAYSSALVGAAIELPPPTASFAQWANRLRQEDRTHESEYWQSQLASQPRMAIQPGQEADAARVAMTLNSETTAILLGRANDAYKTRPEELLLAALVMSLRDWFDPPSIPLLLERHGRSFELGLDVSRAVGWFTSTQPMTIDAGTGDPRSTIIAAKESVRSAPSDGLGYGILRYLGRDEALRQLETPAIVFNYLGAMGNTSHGSFEVIDSAESTSRSPANRRPFPLEIVAAVESSRLTFTWHFSRREAELRWIERAADRLRSALQEIAAHCESEGVGGFTPSDFPASNMSQNDLDELFRELR